MIPSSEALAQRNSRSDGVAGALQDVLYDLNSRKLTETGSPTSYLSEGRKFIEFIKIRGETESMNALAAYIDHLSRPSANGKRLAAATYNKRLAAAKKLLKGLLSQHEGILTAAEVAQLKGKLADYKPKKINHAGPSRDKFLRRDEVEQLIAGTKDQTVSLVIEYLWRTGCRISEALGQLQADVHLNGHKLAKVRVLGKGSKERWVRVPKELINRLKGQFGGTTYLFEHNGKPYSPTSMTSRIGLESLKVLGKQISAHAIRHSFADYLINVERRSLDVVRQMMGHSSISTTQRYLHSQPEDADWEILGADCV